MKSKKTEPIKLIKDAIHGLDLHYDDSYLHIFQIYLSMIRKWSRAYNLTSLKKDRDIVIKHFIDSIMYIKAIPESAATLLDVGSGAGFPGVPIKIIRPETKVYLLEPSRKKISFLKNLIKELALSDIFAVRCRVEEYPCGNKDMPETFDVITTRALFKTEEFIARTGRLCTEDGIMIISKGPGYTKELDSLEKNSYEIMATGLDTFGLDRKLVVIRPAKK